MKGLARWTTALATVVCFAGAAASAQQTPSTSSSASQPATAHGQHRAPQEHLNEAKAALDEIPAASLTGTAAARVAELKRHLSALERAAATHPGHGAAASDRPAANEKENWSTDVAAIDRIVTELLAGSGTSGANQPAGTSGTAAAPASTATEGAAALDESARTKLQEVRTHVAAFAAAMRVSASPGATRDNAGSAAAATTPSATETPGSASASSTTSSPGTPAAEQAQTTPPASTSPPTATPATPESSAPQAAAQDADPDAAKRHLTAARDALSEVTQLPAAAELTGEARTQVSQLITNFNELITTNVEWRAAYAKVIANLTTLIGDQRTDESPSTQATGTPGAIGTSGTVALDPAIRAKLAEFRAHLLEFEKAAGGGASSSASSAAMPSSATAAGATGEPQTSARSTGAVATTGTTSAQDAPEPTGTSGTTPPEPQTRPAPARTQSTDPTDSKEEGHAEAMRHIEAIETILNGRAPDRPTGTSGTSTTDRAAALDNDEIQQIRSHLAELRRLLGQR